MANGEDYAVDNNDIIKSKHYKKIKSKFAPNEWLKIKIIIFIRINLIC